jgi:hypothetical protein
VDFQAEVFQHAGNPLLFLQRNIRQRTDPDPDPEKEKENSRFARKEKENAEAAVFFRASDQEVAQPQEKETPTRLGRRSRRPPQDFVVTKALRQWAGSTVPMVLIDQETARWLDHEYKDPKSDWVAAWKNWMRYAGELLPPRTAVQPPDHASCPQCRKRDPSQDARAFQRRRYQHLIRDFPRREEAVAHLRAEGLDADMIRSTMVVWDQALTGGP